ncbi:S8 family serine peptidase [Streptomyces sp. SID8379]|uniref:S8 family peptidase n=1 Tax=unclassified Streptomyces TaxID=2593676 RepID=UPI00035F091A|nr:MULTISPECIES: S8 family serine peptidase [unclassified Streptomyces]MYW64771.1 S8 family serine peptidase [Streptomyces sp. SID8379]
MHRQVHSRTRRAALVAGAAAVALVAGAALPANSAPAAAHSGAGQQVKAIKARSHVTLITGDRVALDAQGKPVGFERAKGRAHIPVQTRIVKGHTYVVPLDAQRMIASGKLDQRLFDVTELSKASYKKAQKNGLKVIVGYSGAAAAAKAEVRDAGDTTVRRSLKALNADAVLTPKSDAVDLWNAVTDQDGTTASGVSRIWLDGIRRASLDKSVPQIGAPKAWAAGYDGKGVKIAVLDTGVDATHPDLKDQVAESKNFTAAADATDHFGHGTHVASIAAGTGAKSGGKFKGVAPGAKLLNGKVLDDSGFGDDSGILAGMEWAAAQGADVINLSLGGYDTPEIDPLEAEVNKLSAEKGVLFAIAAGNEGPNSIGSPGSADAALTVGAVDDKDQLADFSSTGPRAGDGAIKPDVTAPGVDITAAAAPGSVIEQEVGQNPDGYLTISGTSMATPHVAGAAAILKQQHPDWKYTELKGALVGSTKGTAKLTPFQQGSGRIQVDKAITQTVFADPASVSFGVAQWPHTDDKAVTKKVTYKNAGTKDVTLTLAVQATGPKGAAAPAGFFKLGATKVTVPAGGTASVDLTANTKLGGTVDGDYSAYITATGDGQSVRTAAAVQREVESYDVTLKHIGRDGKDAKNYDTSLFGLSGSVAGAFYGAYDPNSGTVKVRVPKGSYTLTSNLVIDPEDATKGIDWLAQPKLSVTKNTTVTLDARTAKPVDITVPDTGVESLLAAPSFDVSTSTMGAGFGWLLDSYKGFRTAGLGGDITGADLQQQWQAIWTKGTNAEYNVFSGGPVKRLATGYTKHYKASDLATVKVGLGASVSGKTGSVSALGMLPSGSGGWSTAIDQKLPGSRTLHLSTGDKVKWGLDFSQNGPPDEEGWPTYEAGYSLGAAQSFTGGKTYEKTFNTAVFGPRIGGSYGVFRKSNTIAGYLPMFADGKTHAGSSVYSSVKTTLYRGSTKVGENDDPLVGEKVFKVPSTDAAYELTTSIKRSARIATASSRIDGTWTFRSKKTSTETKLPLSAARFDAAVGLDSRVTAGKTQSVPVTVTGAAAGSNLKSLAVYVSYDGGAKWTKVTVKSGKISVKNPAAGKGVSFRAKITDKKGNTSTISIYNAYYGK